MQKVTIQGESRTATGKSANKSLRTVGKIPAVIYGGGENISFSTTLNEVRDLVYTPDFKSAVIELDGHTYECILKDIQFHPVTDEILHIDFLKMVEGQHIKYNVPIQFKGVSPGVKNGGRLVKLERRVKLKSIPEKMVDNIFLDISKLKMGGTARVKDLEIPGDLIIENELSAPVAIVQTPRAIKATEIGDDDDDMVIEGEESSGEESGENTTE